MLDKRQQFKVGFLLKAAQLGLTLPELESLLEADAEKQAGASDWIKAIPGIGLLQHAGEKAIDTGFGLGANLADKGMTAAIMAPIGLGAIAGHSLAKTPGLGSDETPEEEKQRELIDAYRRAAETARLNQAVSARRSASRSRPSYGIL